MVAGARGLLVAAALLPMCSGFVPTSHAAAWARSPLRSTMDADFPSDSSTDAYVDRKKPAPGTTSDNPILRDSIKKEIIRLGATTNRGQVATQDEKNTVADLVFQLEALNPTPVTTDIEAMGGTWELIFSDVQPFRSSPFFMAVGELFSQDRSRAETAFALHRAATSNGEIGRVRQIISKDELVSEVDLRVGLLSGVPFALEGTVVSKAKIEALTSETYGVVATTTSLKNSNVLSFLNDAVSVPVEQAFSLVRGAAPEVQLTTYYLDVDFRISRTPDEHFFVYARAQNF